MVGSNKLSIIIVYMERDINVEVIILDDPQLIVKPIQTEERPATGINPAFPDHPSLLFISSGTGAGKTSLIQYLLIEPYLKFFNKIFFFCPTLDGAWKKLKINKDRVFEGYSDDKMRQVIEEIDEDEDQKCLIIVDDCTSTNIFRPKNVFSQFLPNHRHHPSLMSGTSVWIVGHQFHTLQKSIRCLIKDLIVFRIEDADELNDIADANRGLMKKKDFMELYELCTDEKYNFMYIKKEGCHRSEMFRKNFEMIFKITYK